MFPGTYDLCYKRANFSNLGDMFKFLEEKDKQALYKVFDTNNQTNIISNFSLESHDGENNLIKLPLVRDVDTYNTDDQKKFTAAMYLGLPIVRGFQPASFSPPPTNAQYFCPSRKAIYNGYIEQNLPIDYSDIRSKCYKIEEVNKQRPCVLTLFDVKSTFSGMKKEPLAGFDQSCILGLKSEFFTIDINNFDDAYYHPYFNNTSQLVKGSRYKNLDHVEVSSDLDLCRLTVKDILEDRSNKGCISFLKYDESKNELSFDDKEMYENCTRCIYSENPEFNPDFTMSFNSGASPTTDISDFNSEPFWKPIPGRIYTEVGGCVDTSNPSSIVNTFMRIALGIMGAVVILRIIQGALTLQKGDDESIEEGKDIIMSALIGLLVIILSTAILNFIGINILQIDGFTPFG
jgi:hypothetical protein